MEAAGGRYGKHTGQVRVGCEAASAQSRLTNEPMTFTSEQTLVDTFVGLLETNRSPWGEVRLAREFDYSRGRTDVVAVADADTLIAVEAKLTDWKYALHQAYRNTCFAHRSFVLLPKEAAIAAGVGRQRRRPMCFFLHMCRYFRSNFSRLVRCVVQFNPAPCECAKQVY